MQQPRWGILATGWVAQEFARDLTAHGHTVSAVGSRRADSAQRFADEFGIPRAHGSYEDLVADDTVDIVYIASPNPFHCAHALLALGAGKHVLVEKPFTMDAAEARRVRDAARAADLAAMEAMWVRFLPHMQEVRAILAAGALGRVRTLLADHTRDLPRDPAHRINAPELGGGALLDLGIYPVSLAHHLLGRPTAVSAQGALKATGVDEQVGIVLRHADDAITTMVTTTEAQGRNEAVLLGSEARLEIAPAWDPARLRVVGRDGTVLAESAPPVTGRGMQYQAREFERMLAAGERESPLMPLDESVEIMATLDEIRARAGADHGADRRATP